MHKVPVLQVNPHTGVSELCNVELSDLDDFLEDISSDYDLSHVELGSFLKKIGKAVKKVGKVAGRATLAVGTGGASEAVINRKKLVKAARKVGSKVGRAALAVSTAGASEAAIRLGRKAVKGGRKQRQAVQTAAKQVAALKTAGQVAAKLPAVQLSRPALVHKAAAQHAAQAVTQLAPALPPRAAATIGAAVSGTPLRPLELPKPVARKVARSKAAGKRPAIVASAKKGSPEPGELKRRYAKRKQANKGRAMGRVQFNLTISGLLGKLGEHNTSPAVASSLRRLRLVTGVGNAQ